MTEKLAELYVGADTELMALLNNVAPGIEYAEVRKLCRRAAQRIQNLARENRELKEQLGEDDAE